MMIRPYIGAAGWERGRSARLRMWRWVWGVRSTAAAGGFKATNSRRYGGIRSGPVFPLAFFGGERAVGYRYRPNLPSLESNGLSPSRPSPAFARAGCALRGAMKKGSESPWPGTSTSHDGCPPGREIRYGGSRQSGRSSATCRAWSSAATFAGGRAPT